MANESKPQRGKRLRKVETVRERQVSAAQQKPKRIRKTASQLSRPFKLAHRTAKKEVYLPLPNTKAGNFLNKRRSIIPKYFKDSWYEVRQVKWPTNRETFKLTIAVFIFALGLGLIIALVDFGLDKLFREFLL